MSTSEERMESSGLTEREGKALQTKIPLIFTVIGFVGGGLLWLRQVISLPFGAATLFSTAAFMLYAGWIAWESRVSVAELDRERTDRDGGTLELVSFSKACVILGSLVPAFEPVPAVALVGLGTALTGILFRAYSIATIGPTYSHRIRPPQLPLVTRGSYGLIRHPAYLGTLLAHTGMVLVFLNPWSLTALLVLWYPAVLRRTIIEDRYLRTFPAYADYARQVRFKMIPRVF